MCRAYLLCLLITYLHRGQQVSGFAQPQVPEKLHTKGVWVMQALLHPKDAPASITASGGRAFAWIFFFFSSSLEKGAGISFADGDFQETKKVRKGDNVSTQTAHNLFQAWTANSDCIPITSPALSVCGSHIACFLLNYFSVAEMVKCGAR